MSAGTKKPYLAVTMGDPAGIGPELCLRLLREAPVLEQCVPVVFGSVAVLRRVAAATGLPGPEVVRTGQPESPLGELRGPCVVDWSEPAVDTVRPGTIDAACGRASFTYIQHAIDAALRGDVAAVVTAPIHKEALARAGIGYAGHTEMFAERAGTGRTCMMLTAPALTVSLVTTHVGYREVPGRLTVQRILDVIELTAEAMRRLRGRDPRLLVAGLNPHAGERGLFGDGEEERVIAPAVAAARQKGLAVEGPLPPDTLFVRARRDQADAMVCMYHDQGLIPFKMIAFEEGVNVTLGLSIVRTSVDHGTAFELAWQGRARPDSLYAACRLATRLAG